MSINTIMYDTHPNTNNVITTFIVGIIICFMITEFTADVMYKKIEQIIINKKIKEQQLNDELDKKDAEIMNLINQIIELSNKVNLLQNDRKESQETKDQSHNNRTWSSIIITDDSK